MVDDIAFVTMQLELLLHGHCHNRISVRLLTDLESTFEFVISLRKMERKSFMMTVRELKDNLINGKVASYVWHRTDNMWADVLTKEMTPSDGLERVLLEKEMDLFDVNINMVRSVGGNVQMENT